MKENEYLETATVERTENAFQVDETSPIKSARLFLNDVSQCLEYIYNQGREEYRGVLLELIDKFVVAKTINADADDFHNISVQLSRRNEDELAIRVLEVGLKNFPWNTDLLADYIQFGTSISQVTENSEYDRIQKSIEECYNKLMQVPKSRWTWRAYSFSIDYLVDFLLDKENPEKSNSHIDKAYKLAQEFVEQYSSDESYVSLSKVLEKRDGPKAALKILTDALNSLKVAPKCAMRYAEKKFNEGDYKESLTVAKRGIKDAAQTQQKVSLGYLYLLSGLSKISLMESSTLTDEDDAHLKSQKAIKKQQVLDIYCDFNIAVREFGRNSEEYLGIIQSQTNALIDKTSIKIPEDKYEELNNLILSR